MSAQWYIFNLKNAKASCVVIIHAIGPNEPLIICSLSTKSNYLSFVLRHTFLSSSNSNSHGYEINGTLRRNKVLTRTFTALNYSKSTLSKISIKSTFIKDITIVVRNLKESEENAGLVLY